MTDYISLANELRQLSKTMLKMAEQLDVSNDLHLVKAIDKARTNHDVGFRNGLVSGNAVRALLGRDTPGPQRFGEMMQSAGLMFCYRINTPLAETVRFPDAGVKTRIYTTMPVNQRLCEIAKRYDAAQQTVDVLAREL